MRIVVAADCMPQPWANGGGTTRDLALEAGPRGASDGPAFDWRLSLADIDRDGAFSRLPGVDRVFAPVEGSVVLSFTPSGLADLREADGPPLAFDGEASPDARLPSPGRCRALNLMLARGRRAGAMRRVALADGAALDAGWSRSASDAGAAVRACWLQRGRLAAGDRMLEPGVLLVLEPEDAAPRAVGEALLLEVAIGPPGAAALPAQGDAPVGLTDLTDLTDLTGLTDLTDRADRTPPATTNPMPRTPS
jgi:environmental stress-induced protein Ves